jgi:sugar/nucleoside kinase (ribokinase family)
MCELLGLGGLTCDMLSVIPEMPPWEGTTYIEEYQMQQGGMAATAIVAASKLGAGTEYIGGISNDLQGEFLKHNFQKYQVKSDRIRVFENELSPFTIVLIDKGTGKRTFLHKKGVQERAELCKADLDLTGVRLILFDGFYFDTALRTAEQARKRGIVSVTDLSPRNRNPKLLQYLGLIDYPILSELFVKSYLQTEDVLEAGKKLYTKNNQALLVTCGDRGVYVITAEGSEHIPAFKVKPLDTTGAGDVFHGAFLFSLWKGYPLHEAVLFSSAVSALKCTKIGGQSGIPDFNETKRFLIRHLPSCAAWLK